MARMSREVRRPSPLRWIASRTLAMTEDYCSDAVRVG